MKRKEDMIDPYDKILEEFEKHNNNRGRWIALIQTDDSVPQDTHDIATFISGIDGVTDVTVYSKLADIVADMEEGVFPTGKKERKQP